MDVGLGKFLGAVMGRIMMQDFAIHSAPMVVMV
jgi:hypothetical protein